MEKKSKYVISPAFRGLYILIGLIVVSFVLGGEHTFAATAASTDASSGFFQQYFVQPFTYCLDALASLFGGSYGLSVIFMTLVVRLLIMPLMLKSTKSQYAIKDKMAVMQPEMKAIQDKMKLATTAEQKTKLQQELMAVYQKHGVNPMASLSGCLPLLIQMPILMGFYYAIRNSPEIASHSFLWFDLGQPDLILAALAAAVYFIQFKFSLIGMPEEQKSQMAIMGYISPIMMGAVSLTAPAALPLYWVVGGCFLILQTYIMKKLYSPATITIQETKN